MKEIGEKLREAREKIDISLEEASEDLKVDSEILKKIEEGDKESFKDVLYLKYYIRDYAKYLGLNSDELVEEFNEYLFEHLLYTSHYKCIWIRKKYMDSALKELIVCSRDRQSSYFNHSAQCTITQWNKSAEGSASWPTRDPTKEPILTTGRGWGLGHSGEVSLKMGHQDQTQM